MIIFERAVARAKEIYITYARDAAEARGEVGPKSLHEILPAHVERQEEALELRRELLTSWGIDFNKLKLALALTDIAKANPDVTFNALLAFKDRDSQNLPDTAVKLAMKPVGIDLVELIYAYQNLFDDEATFVEENRLLKQLRGLSNVLLHAEAGRLMVAETLEILGQTQEDLTGESGPASPTRREAYRLGAEVADQITGHDSFRAGFGKEVLPRALGGMIQKLCECAIAKGLVVRHEESSFRARVSTIQTELMDPGMYPPSQNMEGFILQILDRLEALEASTQLRYVTEGMAFQGKSLDEAITGGIHANLSGLKKIHQQLLEDIDASKLSELDKKRLISSPFMKEFETGLEVFEQVLSVFEPPACSDGHYSILDENGCPIEIRKFEDLERVYPAAFERKAAEVRAK